MRSIYWQAMPKVKKKSDKQRQRLDKVPKRDDRATNEKAVSKNCVEKSSIPSEDVHVANNNLDGTPYMSNRSELLSRNFAAIGSPNVCSEAQAIVDKYLQSQKDLADRAKKKYTDCHSVQQSASDRCNERSVKCNEMRHSTMQNGKGAPDHFQNSGNMNNNATEWKCRWLGKIQCTGILNENVTKKERKWPGKMQRTGILRKKKKKKMARKQGSC